MVPTWKQLLSRQFDDVGQEWGPRSQEVAALFWALSKAPWFAHVGHAVNEPGMVAVADWGEALKVFDDVDRYPAVGHLEKPWRLVREAISDDMPESAWWDRALEDSAGYMHSWREAIPPSLPRDASLNIGDHVLDSIKMAIGEILGASQVSYFRTELQWLVAGHLPCGWEGDWPLGRMRVF